ncbi:SHD1 domain-containing protein [bacterium]|nr:SHD1 domain-containing protein [bacterium]
MTLLFTGNKMSKYLLPLPHVSKVIPLCLAVTAILTSFNFALSESPARQWKDASGKFEITGSLLKADDSEVTLLVEGKGEIQVPIKKLCDRDRDYVDGIAMLEDDALQYALVMEHLPRLRTAPASTIDILQTIHDGSPEAPYAASMLGIAYAAGRAEYRLAGKYLRLASRSIKARQKILGDDYHKLTELAVNNNLSVVNLKLSSGGKAFNLMKSNFELTTKDINFSTFHNAKLLLEAVENKTSPISFPSTSRKQLSKLLEAIPTTNTNFGLPQKMVYSLQWSSPMPKSSFESLQLGKEGQKLPNEFESATLDRNQLYPDVWCFYCRGTAIHKCPNQLCVGGKIEKRRPFLARVDPNTGEKFYGTERYYVRCPTCGGANKVKCPNCVEGKSE